MIVTDELLQEVTSVSAAFSSSILAELSVKISALRLSAVKYFLLYKLSTSLSRLTIIASVGSLHSADVELTAIANGKQPEPFIPTSQSAFAPRKILH